MSTRTPSVPVQAGSAIAFAATVPAGDEVAYGGGDLLIEFVNGHSSSITINIAPTKTTGVVPGGGKVTIPTRTLALAQDAHGVFLFKRSEISSYLNANGRVPLAYTSGNVALLVRALRID